MSTKQGISPLTALAPEIWVDVNATAFSVHLLKQMGVAGMVITIKDQKLKPEELAATRKYVSEEYTGKKRGSPMVIAGDINVHPAGLNPQQMFLPQLHNFSEERVCAVYGIPAAVIGFGTGLQQTKVGATLQEQERQAWQNAVLPVQADIANTLESALLPDMPEFADWTLEFDTSGIGVLQEDELKRVTSWQYSP